MTPVMHRNASTEMGEGKRQESQAITRHPWPDEFFWAFNNPHRFSSLAKEENLTDTKVTRQIYAGPGSWKNIGVITFAHGAEAYYVRSPFLDDDRVAIQSTCGTVDGLEVGGNLAQVLGCRMALRAIRAESTEGHTPWPPANDATNVVLTGQDPTDFVNNQFLKLVRDATDEVFVDGMESAFASQLRILVENYGRVAVHAIEGFVRSGTANIEAVGEILRVIGSVEDRSTHGGRLAVLLASLASPDPRIRDAASLGIAELDDPTVVGRVEAAAEREQIPVLQRNLQLVVDQLRSTEWQTSSE